MAHILEKIGKDLEKIGKKYHWINAGGCASFAVELYETFEKLDISAKIYALIDTSESAFLKAYHSSASYRNEFSYLKAFTAYGVNFYHVVVEAAGMVFDSNGIELNIESAITAWGCRSAVEVDYGTMKILANSRGWNSTFDRGQLPNIKQDLNMLSEKFKMTKIKEYVNN